MFLAVSVHELSVCFHNHNATSYFFASGQSNIHNVGYVSTEVLKIPLTGSAMLHYLYHCELTSRVTNERRFIQTDHPLSLLLKVPVALVPICITIGCMFSSLSFLDVTSDMLFICMKIDRPFFLYF